MKKINGKEEIDKRVEKDKFVFSTKYTGVKEKIPIALNTLLINGIEQQNAFISGNLKRHAISKN